MQGREPPVALLGAGAALSAATIAAWLGGALGATAGWYALALSGPVAIGAALFAAPGAPPHTSGRARTLVDGLIVGGSALLVAWTAGLAELYGSADTDARVLLAHAVGFVVVAACSVVALTRARPSGRRTLAPLTLGLLCIATASAALAYVAMGGSSWPAWTLLAGWLAGGPLVARGAGAGGRDGDDEPIEPGLPTHPSVFIPSIPFAIGVLAVAANVASETVDDFLIWDGAIVMVLVVARQMFALAENISFWRGLEAKVQARTDELRRSEERFRSLVQNSSDVITLVDPHGAVLYQSPASEAVFGYRHDQLDSAMLLDVVHPSDREAVEEAAEALGRRPADTASIQCRVRHRDGSWRDVEAVVTNLLHDPAVGAFVINTRDITERKRSEQLAHQAFHDPLTNLANRALFSHRVEEALARRPAGDCTLAILFVDLDDFKDVNDRFGHAEGDVVLAEAAARLHACMRSTDVVARYGGDEFAILVEGIADELELTHLATRLLGALESEFEVAGEPVTLSASIGIAHCPEAGETAARLLRSADLAMYAAKSNGKASYRVFEPTLGSKLIERVAIHARAA